MLCDVSKRLFCATLLLALSVFPGLALAQEHAERHYEVTWIKDMPLTFASAFFSVYGNYRYSQLTVPAQEDVPAASRLLPWDRPVAGRHSDAADKVSDWAVLLGVSPIALSAYSWAKGDASGGDFGSYLLIFAQALALQNGMNMLVRCMQLWPRPYVYAKEGRGLEAAEKAEGEAYGSFFSGHTSAAFTIAVFTGEWFSEVYPSSPYRGIVWAGSLSAAGFVGFLRIAAGKHYPTDVVAGALIGTGLSFSIIRMHKASSKKVSLYAGPDAAGVTLRF